jgi:hypothetical protein
MDTVTLYYYYTRNDIGIKNFTAYFPISVPASNYTMAGNKDRTYGLGLVERVLVSVICIIIVVGICAMMGQIIPGMGLGLVCMGYLMYIGFLPLWAGLLPVIMGVLYLITKVEY